MSQKCRNEASNEVKFSTLVLIVFLHFQESTEIDRFVKMSVLSVLF